ncbi:MAG: hypothetical protein ABIX12_00410 [Rubrivivax sp.]
MEPDQTPEQTTSFVSNPFMLMLHPEEVLAAMERSDALGRLNRRTCHPLDRIVPPADSPADAPAAKTAGRAPRDQDDDDGYYGFGVTIN